MTIKNLYPSVLPSLNLDFANSRTLDPRVSFARASVGTYVGSDGLIKTAATNEPRFDHNPTTGESLGLLVEEQRTNLLLRSEEFDNAFTWGLIGTATANATTAPNGTITADLATANGTHAQLAQGITISSGATITGSCFLKPNGINEIEIFLLASNNTTPYGRATFNVSTGVISVAAATANGGTNASANIQAFANGWYRCSVTVTYPAVTSAGIRINAAVATGGIFLWGAQLEAGSFPTSYIPTTTAAATRAADVAQITGTNFSSWYRQDEGTVFASARTNATQGGVNSFPRIVAVSDGTNNNQMETYYRVASSYTDAGYGVVSAGTTQATFDTNNNRNGQNIAFAYASNDFPLVIGGTVVATDTSGTVPIVSRLGLGAKGDGGFLLNGTIKRLTYWPQRLPNSTLEAITQP